MPNSREWSLLPQSVQLIYIGQDALLRPLPTAPEHVVYLLLIESKVLTNFVLETLPTCGLHVHMKADRCFCAIIE